MPPPCRNSEKPSNIDHIVGMPPPLPTTAVHALTCIAGRVQHITQDDPTDGGRDTSTGTARDNVTSKGCLHRHWTGFSYSSTHGLTG